MLQGRCGLRPLAELWGADSPWAGLHAGWLADRKPLLGRRYGAASNLSVSLAKQAAHAAGWTGAQLRDAWVFAGTSRGNTAELLGERHGRRPHPIYSASNSLHSEVAAAVSIELGIRGAWQTFTNGCAAGLDAAGFAAMAVATGMAPRAIVVSVELPLLPALLGGFSRSGLLSTTVENAPYGSQTAGFYPAEAGAALTLEAGQTAAFPCITGAWWNSDAYDPVALPPDGAGLRDLLQQVLADLGQPHAICPHATGTAAHGRAEAAAIRAAVGDSASLHLMKPYTGHALGASGALDLAMLWQCLMHKELPPNLPSAAIAEGLHLPTAARPVSAGTKLLKISTGMGGHNCVLSVQA
jgi:3-oxoacyl-(acyl-carrier-protein) synthase